MMGDNANAPGEQEKNPLDPEECGVKCSTSSLKGRRIKQFRRNRDFSPQMEFPVSFPEFSFRRVTKKLLGMRAFRPAHL
jgi:hypothetical protein